MKVAPHFGPEHYDERFGLEQQYDFTAFGVNARLGPYDDSEDDLPPTNRQIIDDIVKRNLPGPYLDIGTADMSVPIKMRELGITDRIVAIDVQEPSGFAKEKADHLGIEHKVESVLNIDAPDSSFKVVTAGHLLYHLPTHFREAIREIIRVQDPDSWAYYSTSGEHNKEMQRGWQAYFAYLLGVEQPVDFADPFNANVMQRVLPEYYGEVEFVHWQTRMAIKTHDRALGYAASMLSMGIACNPPQYGPWQKLIDERMMPQIEEEIRQNGAYYDTIDQIWARCRYPKK